MAADAELATALKQAKTKPMFFAFVAKGSDSKLLVGKKKITPKDATEAKKECGGGTIYKGRCRGDDGTMVFEVAKQVPETLSALTKKIIKQNAGLTFEVEYRVATDLEDEEDEKEETEKPEPADDLVGRWKNNLAAWTPAIKTAMAAKGPRAPDIAKLLAQATALSKPGGDMAQALARLSECHELATTSVETEAEQDEAEQEEAEETGADAKAEVTQRLKVLMPEFQKIKGSPIDTERNFSAAVAKMLDLSSKGLYAKALELLEVVEPAIRSAARVAGAKQEIKQQAGGDVVRFRTCRLEWDSARKTAEQQIGAFVSAVLAEEELQNDPQFAEISANLDKLKDKLAPFGEELYDLLDQAMVAKTEEERAERNRACLAQIEKYRKLLASADVLDGMEETTFGSFTVYSALSDAIDKMAGLLA